MYKIPRGTVYFPFRVIKKAWISVFSGVALKGKSTALFEKRFAEYIGTKYALSTSSGKIALYLCLKALGLQQGDEVILPSYTVSEVASIILSAGARPVFIDIDPLTDNMDAHLIEERITEKTRFILLTHIYGQPCDIEPIMDIAKKYSLKVIEDCAQACGAEYKGKKVGCFGDLAYFSFGLMKNLNTLGGSMITTNDKSLAEMVKKELDTFLYPRKRNLIKRLFFASILHCFTRPIVFSIFAYPVICIFALGNSKILYSLLGSKRPAGAIEQHNLERYKRRFTNLQAIVGIEQLKDLDRNNDLRITNAMALDTFFNGHDIEKVQSLPYVKNIYLNYVIRIKERRKVIRELLHRGIDVTNGYVESCAARKEFQKYKRHCPASEKLANENLYLPIQPPLAEVHMAHIAKSIKEIVYD